MNSNILLCRATSVATDRDADNALTAMLERMKEVYQNDPEVAVRSKKFINELQEYCACEIRARVDDADNIETKTEIGIQTPYSSKKVDVVTVLKNNGPVITISVKSQMSSVMKNFIHYYEGVVGDVTGLHKRFPFASIGMIWLFPLQPIKEGKETETINFDQIEKMFLMATGRRRYTEDYAKHECFCMLVVDFNKEPPELVCEYPKSDSLKIDSFFDVLTEMFKSRTPGLD